MNGIGIMLKSMGLDPEKIETAIETVTSQISVAVKELERQGKLMDRIAAALNIGDTNTEENENGLRDEFAGNGCKPISIADANASDRQFGSE